MTNPDEAVTTVYLIRHGRTDLNRAGRLRGRVDAPLDEVGRAEADRLAALFAGVKLAAVLTSPVQRTVQTAVPLAASTNAPLRRVMAFLDRDYGPWNGRLKRPAFECRVLAGLQAAAGEYAGLACVVVAHDAVNRAVLAWVDGRFGDPELVPQRIGCWNRLRRAEGRWRVLVVDAVPGDGHYPTEPTEPDRRGPPPVPQA